MYSIIVAFPLDTPESLDPPNPEDKLNASVAAARREITIKDVDFMLIRVGLGLRDNNNDDVDLKL